MSPQCPLCGEPISADNDYLTCECCGEMGCEECVCGDPGPLLCDDCGEAESGNEVMP
jgi:hypothetical protein